MLMGEFATAVKYRLPIKVVIIKNNTLGMIKWEQMVFLGNPEYGVSLEPIDFVKFAEACGGVGFRCERPEEARPALEAMMLADGPALVEAIVDPFEPPMPARVNAKQALHMAEALARGEPNRGRIALTLFRDKVRISHHEPVATRRRPRLPRIDYAKLETAGADAPASAGRIGDTSSSAIRAARLCRTRTLSFPKRPGRRARTPPLTRLPVWPRSY